MKSEDIHKIEAGDLIFVHSSCVVWSGPDDIVNPDPGAVGYEALIRQTHVTVMETLDREATRYILVLLHKPVFGLHSSTQIQRGWIWAGAAHEALTLRKKT